MSFGRSGGFWTGIAAASSAIVVIVLAVLFSALFLGLFVAVGIGLAVRAWLLGRGTPSRPGVIDGEYAVVDTERSERPPRP
jgi:apolipoprotein N-acyltransferase